MQFFQLHPLLLFTLSIPVSSVVFPSCLPQKSVAILLQYPLLPQSPQQPGFPFIHTLHFVCRWSVFTWLGLFCLALLCVLGFFWIKRRKLILKVFCICFLIQLLLGAEEVQTKEDGQHLVESPWLGLVVFSCGTGWKVICYPGNWGWQKFRINF